MKSGGIFLLLIIIISSCRMRQPETKKTDLAVEKASLIAADKKFSDLSVEKGMKQAFLEYIDSNGVLLRPGRAPIMGAQAIDFLIQQNDTSYTMNWEPQQAFVSNSADLGYTYGLYALHPNDQDTVFYGTYVSIWKKQKDGSWKFVLDTGNEGAEDN